MTSHHASPDHPLPPGGDGRRRDPALELLHTQRQLTQLHLELKEMRGRLNRRSQQMAVLQQVSEMLAATPKGSQVAGVLLEALGEAFGALRGLTWTLDEGGATFAPRQGLGILRADWGSLVLPAPNPFPGTPLVLYQTQTLEPSVLPPVLRDLLAPDDAVVLFLPFEHQLLLLGFSLVTLPRDKVLEVEDHESITILQRQASIALHNAWLFRDLAEQRDALKRQARELEKANLALKQADEMKSEFLALTSHELRTPLTGILGFTRLVMDGLYSDEAEMRSMLQDSYTSGQHLLALLNDILDLAKIESGRLEVHPEPVPLHVLLEEVRPVAEAYPRRPGVALLWPCNLEEFPEIRVDPGRFKQVLLNLLSNALKFTKEGFVSIVAEREVDHLVLRVVDTGIGVSAEAQARLFQKFAQAEGGHAREYGGTGLGLVICRHLMEMMGGTIGLFSEGQGKGSTLTLTMPLA